ncbi:MAG: PEGA domain-containing protein [Acidobacteriota bacterium]|nr:PEGA domain-containing protein [Acidobacteriota bacterium]
MNRSIVAIPLLAAIWFGSPARASAQDPEPQPRIAQPRTAVPRPAEPRVSAPEPRVVRAPVAAPAPAPTAAEADDQRGRDRGGRGTGLDNGRGSPRIAIGRPPNVPVYSSNYYNRPGYYPPAYYDNWARRTYRWSPLAYAPWSLIYGSVGFANYGYDSYGGNYGYNSYGYGPSYNSYGYGQFGPFGRSTTFDTGSVRLRIRPRDAQVFVDGYFAGYVDDFDGNFQSLRLEQGGHKLEVRMPGYQTLMLDIHIQPNRTITIREDLIP